MSEIDLTIPMSLGDITLSQYQDYLKILDKWDKEDETYLKLKILQIFCKMSAEDVQKIKLSHFDYTIQHINNLFNEDTSKLVNRFNMTGNDKEGKETTVEFGFIPKLDDISFGEYIDLETYIADWQVMHKAMAVLFRPIIHRKKNFYRVEEYKGSDRYSQVMRDMPLNVALSATVFFYRLGIKLQNCTLDSLAKQMSKAEAQQACKLTLGKSGVGINQYIHLLKETLEGLTKLQRPVFISAL
jgi:hypothetical protein